MKYKLQCKWKIQFQWFSEGKSVQWSIFCESVCGFSLPFTYLLSAVSTYFCGTGKPPPAAGLEFCISKYLGIGCFEVFSALSKLYLSWLFPKAFQEIGRMLPFITRGFLSPLFPISLFLIPIFPIDQSRHAHPLPSCFRYLGTYDSERIFSSWLQMLFEITLLFLYLLLLQPSPSARSGSSGTVILELR